MGDGVADLTRQKMISLNFLYKVMLLPILACKWISSNDYPSKVTTFANFGLNVDLKLVCLDFQLKIIIFANVGLKEASLLRFPV